MLGPHIGRSIPTSPQWKTIQSQQEKCYFVGIPHILPTLAGKVLLKIRTFGSSLMFFMLFFSRAADIHCTESYAFVCEIIAGTAQAYNWLLTFENV